MNPKINVYLNKLQHNTEVLVKQCQDAGIDVAAVTKVFCGKPEIAETIVKGGVKYLADSRIENLAKMKELPLEKILLRLPMISRAKETVQFADISLNSELETIEALNDAALELGQPHKVILMMDLGDLREGIFDNEELHRALKRIKELQSIKVVGIGTNLTCYGGVIPDDENLGRLLETANLIEAELGYPVEMISGGNSSSIYLLEKQGMPKGINHLRLGESIVLGYETAYGKRIPNTFDDAFQLVAEIIEIKEKPSIPIGTIGRDAFGNVPEFEDKGKQRRAILAVGKQDFGTHSIIPLDTEIEILGGSSDHLIIDLTHCRREYKVGDEVTFNLTYGSLLALMTSEYIYKNCIK